MAEPQAPYERAIRQGARIAKALADAAEHLEADCHGVAMLAAESAVKVSTGDDRHMDAVRTWAAQLVDHENPPGFNADPNADHDECQALGERLIEWVAAIEAAVQEGLRIVDQRLQDEHDAEMAESWERQLEPIPDTVGENVERRDSGKPQLTVVEGQSDIRNLIGLERVQAVPADKAVVLVASESNAETVNREWPEVTVTTWAPPWNRTNWQPLDGRHVVLVADGNEISHRAMATIAAHLYQRDPMRRLEIVLPPEDGSTFADWLGQSQKYAVNIIDTHRAEYHPPEAPEDEAIPADSGRDLDSHGLVDNDHYRLLGLVGTQVAIRIAAGQVLNRPRESLMQTRTLNAIAPDPNWWIRLNNGQPITPTAAIGIGAALLREADRIGPVDLSHVTGRGAVRMDDGTVLFHLGDRLLIDEKERPLDLPGKIWVREPRIELASPASEHQAAQLAEAVMRYRWKAPEDGRRMLGWMVCAIIGGALEWRPHMLFTAPASTGKTWIIDNAVKPIMGDLMRKLIDVSGPGLARLTSGTTLPVFIDEAEPTHSWLPEVLTVLRVASSGTGLRVRADMSTGGVQAQTFCFSAMLAGTAGPKLNRADSSRLSRVRLGLPVGDWPSVKRGIRDAIRNADGIRTLIINRAGWITELATKMTDIFQDDGMDSREALTAGALTAGWQFWGLDRKRIVMPATGKRITDAGDALLDVLALRVKVASGQERSVLSLLQGNLRQQTLADLYGVRREGLGMVIAPRHRGLIKAMLHSDFRDTDLRQLLMQIPGAQWTANARRFGGLRTRGIVLTHEVLREIGIDLRLEETTPRGGDEGWQPPLDPPTPGGPP